MENQDTTRLPINGARTASTAALRTLPHDIHRQLWYWLDTDSLVKLYTTDDNRIKNSLASPGAIDAVAVFCTERYPSSQMSSFLCAVRNVNKLEVMERLAWPIETIGLFLPTLNPLHLRIGFHSVQPYLKRWVAIDSVRELRNVAHTFQGCAMLDLSHFTPRLVSLDFLAAYPKQRDDIDLIEPPEGSRELPTPASIKHLIIGYQPNTVLVVPPTLTSANICKNMILHRDTNWADRFPKSLSSFSLDYSDSFFEGTVALSQYASHLDSLQSFAVTQTHGRISIDSLTLPKTLTELTLVCLDFLPLELFNSADGGQSPFKDLPLTSLNLKSFMFKKLTLADTHTVHLVNLARVLPSGIENLSLATAWTEPTTTAASENVVFTKLPLALKRFTLTANTFQPLCLLNLHELTSLSHLSINYNHAKSPTVVTSEKAPALPTLDELLFKESVERSLLTAMDQTHFKMVPANVKHLSLGGAVFNSMPVPTIDDLPKGLNFLSVASCDFQWALTLRKRLPGCLLSLSEPLLIWHGEWATKLQEQFFKFWHPHLDVCRFAEAALRYYTGIGIFFEMEMNGKKVIPPDVKFDEVERFVFRPTDRTPRPLNDPFNFDQLKQIVPNVESVMLTQPRLHKSFPANALKLPQFPDSVTHLELWNQPIVAPVSRARFELGNLVCITSNAGYWRMDASFKFEQFPNLRYLDAPKWAFDCSKLNCIAKRNFEKLSASLRDIPSVDIPNFLANFVSCETRSNMAVTLTVHDLYNLTTKYPTARSIADSELGDHCDSDKIGFHILGQLLQQPMPASSASSTETAITSSQGSDTDDIIGSVVTAITNCHQPYRPTYRFEYEEC